MDLKELPTAPAGRHPWEVARARFFRDLLAARGLVARSLAVCDVGAGDGYLARTLAEALPRASRVVCFDAHYTDDDLRRLAGGDGRVIFTRDEPAGPFDLMLVLDVIEHVPDDRGFLGGLVARTLRPEGAVLVSVPAWQTLYNRHDVALGHHRRYRPAELRATCEGAGLAVEAAGGVFHSLIGARALRKLVELARGVRARPGDTGFNQVREGEGAGRWSAGRTVTAAIQSALAAETALTGALARRGWSLPGLSCWALARRRW